MCIISSLSMSFSHHVKMYFMQFSKVMLFQTSSTSTSRGHVLHLITVMIFINKLNNAQAIQLYSRSYGQTNTSLEYYNTAYLWLDRTVHLDFQLRPLPMKEDTCVWVASYLVSQPILHRSQAQAQYLLSLKYINYSQQFNIRFPLIQNNTKRGAVLIDQINQ